MYNFYFKKIKWSLPILFLITLLVYSCKSDDNFTEPGDDGGNNSKKDSIFININSDIKPTKEEWEELPLLTNDYLIKFSENSRNISSRNDFPYPAVFDLKNLPLFNQAQMGTCTSSSVGYLVNILNRKITNMPYKSPLGLYDFDARTFSVSFLHHNILSAKGKLPSNVNEEVSGANVLDAFSALKKYGIPTSADYVYTNKNVTSVPTPDIYSKALFNAPNYSMTAYRLDSYYNELGDNLKKMIKNSIDAGLAVSFGMLFPK